MDDDEQQLNVELAYLNNDLRAMHAMCLMSVKDMLHPKAPSELVDDVYPNLVTLACSLLPTGRYKRDRIESVINTLHTAKDTYRDNTGRWDPAVKIVMLNVLLDLQNLIQEKDLFQRTAKKVEMI